MKKTVLITGALAGIGKATAFAFAAEKANLVISGRKADLGTSLAKELRNLGVEVEFIQADVRKESDVQALVEKTVKRFGRLDVAVNSAGIEGSPGLLIDQTVDTYTSTFDTNVLGTFLCLKYQLKAMIPGRSGSIINLSSTLGRKTAPFASMYAATKHAVEGLTKTAALEVAYANIRVNAVAPGPIDTVLLDRFTVTPERKAALISAVPLRRMGRPEEVAQAIVFLGSDKSPFITGQVIGVDGGKMA